MQALFYFIRRNANRAQQFRLHLASRLRIADIEEGELFAAIHAL
jgi:hypothetical protein